MSLSACHIFWKASGLWLLFPILDNCNFVDIYAVMYGPVYMSEPDNLLVNVMFCFTSDVQWHAVNIPLCNTYFKTVNLCRLTWCMFVLFVTSGTVNIPALVVPIAFIMLGIVIATVGGTYIVRLRRKRYVEVADFDFDPSISVTITGPFSSSLSAVKDFFSRIRHQNRSGRSVAPEYSRSHSMYESLWQA